MERKGRFEELYQLDEFEAAIDVEVLLNLWMGSKGSNKSGKVDFGGHGKNRMKL